MTIKGHETNARSAAVAASAGAKLTRMSHSDTSSAMNNLVRHTNPLVILLDEVIRTHGRLRSVFADVNAATGLTSMEAMVLTAIVGARFAPTVPQSAAALAIPGR